jgi:hypothetical protein
MPAWYELDQTISIGLSADFLFFNGLPGWPFDHLEEMKKLEKELIFHSGFYEPKILVAHGTISSIYNVVLGEISEINTHGLNYRVTLADGIAFSVNAEEEPGAVYGYEGKVPLHQAGWLMEVRFSELSDREPYER